MELFSAILPIVLQVVGYFINRSNLSTEQKQAFFEWVRRAGTDLKSARLYKYSEKQLAELKGIEWKESE